MISDGDFKITVIVLLVIIIAILVLAAIFTYMYVYKPVNTVVQGATNVVNTVKSELRDAKIDVDAIKNQLSTVNWSNSVNRVITGIRNAFPFFFIK